MRLVLTSILLIPLLWVAKPMRATAAEALVEATSADVVAIDWTRFEREIDDNNRLAQCTSLLLNCARYNLAWIDRTFDHDEQGQAYVLTRFEEHGVRPACSAVYGMGVVLKSGIFDAEIVGLSEAEATERTIQLLRGIVRTHRANTSQEKAWGVQYPAPEPDQYWQTALWSALSGMGGWLMWEDLDPATQGMLVAMLEQETRRFIHPDYQAPYWNGEGGDTKAEENSWNSMPLGLMTAMMPKHPRAAQWKRSCSELMVSSYATEEDWKTNDAMIDGRPVKKWLAGYNAAPGGVVVNHGFIHPDYMVAISMNFWGLTSQSLAGRRAPQAWDFNASLIYNTLVSKNWKSPPFEAPGGTIYVAGKANVYYPRGNDWSFHDLTLFYLIDVFADIYSWHNDAAAWMDIRAPAMLEMQMRHEDRMMFADGEYDTYPGREQWAFWCLTDAFLPLWLNAHGALSGKANWVGGHDQ
ncbi:hypothetical protein OAS39_02110 [Pirellulales bacterium]|nr:hypothetical protein [Pirellulales bacterium]